MRRCEVCGRTSEETVVYGKGKFNMALCRKHWLQMDRHGKIYKRTIYDPNVIRKEGVFAYIELYDKYGEHIEDAKINIEYADICSAIKWYLRPSGYVYGAQKGRTQKVKLHSFIFEHITGKKVPRGYVIDHISGIVTDNTIENLRYCTHQENMFNIHKESKTVGVHYGVWNGVYKWIPTMMIDGKGIWLGVYDTEEEAIKVRKEAEEKYFTHGIPLTDLVKRKFFSKPY